MPADEGILQKRKRSKLPRVLETSITRVDLSNFGQLRIRRTDGGVSNEAYSAVDAHPSGEPLLLLFVLQMLIDQLSSFAAGKIGIRLGQ
jgi:hypothetical protein